MRSILSLCSSLVLLLDPARAIERPHLKLQIINGSAQPVDIFWLKSDRERVPNRGVEPGQDTIITTTLGHRFVVVGRADKSEATVTSEVSVQAFRFSGVPAFYTQQVSAKGFPIVASAKVDPHALPEAAYLINLMLANRPEVREAMIKSGARMCIMAHDEYTTDLPEFARLSDEKSPDFPAISGKDYWDARARGTGGSATDPYCSSAEENLLCYPGDPYSAECILIHEFAHSIHLRGMSNVDPTFDARLKTTYDAAMKAGLWKGKYASVNHYEYFAEGVQSWFDNNRANDHDHNHVHLRAQLIEYDPGLAAMCREVFGDTVLKYDKPQTRLTDHLAGYEPAKAPKFEWPQRLVAARDEIRARAMARDTGANGKVVRDPRTDAARPDAAGSKPNIVFILADDLGYGDLGCYNKDSKIPTPNLDRLAHEGMRFTDAHAPTSVCSPTRYAILTGRYSWRTRLQRGVLGPWDAPLIAPERLTVASLLKQHGYTTAAIGKWHLGMTWPTKDGQPPSSRTDPMSNVDFTKPIADGPTTRGFDHYFGTAVPNYPPYCFINDDRTVGIPSVRDSGREDLFNIPGPMVPEWKLVSILPELTRHAVKWVEDTAKSGKPFFLYLPLTSPHYPVVPAPEFKGKSNAGEYGDFVFQTDWTVGQVLDALQRAGVADNTLVIFTSDNGPEISGEVKNGAYDRIPEHHHYSMGELRGAKRDVWEGGHRVPYIARWPGKIKADSVSDETMCHVDFMATVAAMLGAKLPDAAAPDSVNVLPVLLGEPRSTPAREATVHHSASGKFAIRKGDWVLIDAASGDDNGARGEPDFLKTERGYTKHGLSGELFNLREDLSERGNHYAEQPDIVRDLKTLLEQYKADGRSTPGVKQQNDIPIGSK